MKKSFGKILCIMALSATTGAWAATWTGETNFTQDTSFDDVYTNSTALTCSAGTSESPIVFSATERTDGLTNGLTQTEGAGNFTLNNGANVKIDSGTYHFANDIVLKGNSGLTLEDGYLTAAYWVVMSGSSTFTINGGAFSTAFRGGVEQTSTTGNGALNISGTASIVQNGGRVHFVGSSNSGDKTVAFLLGNDSKAQNTYTLNGGYLDIDGYTYIGRFGTGSVFNQTGGTNDSLKAFQIALAGGSSGTFNLSGGVATTPDLIEIGYGDRTRGVANVSGGELTGTGTGQLQLAKGTGAYGELNISGDGAVTLDKTTAYIASGSSATGVVSMTGGTFTTVQDVYLGNGNQAMANITIGGTGVFSVGTAGTARWFKVCENNTATNTITLAQGGVLEGWHLQKNKAGSATLVFKGGTLRCLGSDSGNNYYLLGNSGSASTDDLVVTVDEEGGTIDNNGKVVRINRPIKGNDGTLTLTGAGITELCVVPSCGVNVAQGVALFNAGAVFASPVTIGAHGAIAVDITDAIDTTTVQVGDKISLFKTTQLNFEAEGDTLAGTVFLTGPVVGYTLSLDSEDGWVKATVTDVTNIASTRKVTTYTAGSADPTNTESEYHIDHDASWSNGCSTDGGYDVAVYPGDSHLCIYTKVSSGSKWYANNRRAGEMVIRGGALFVRVSNDMKWPNLETLRIAGNGTLILSQVGLQSRSNCDLVVDPTVTVEFSCAGASATQDTWAMGSGTGVTTINGSVVVTNGRMCVYQNVVFNGPVLVGQYGSGNHNSYLSADTTINNTWTIADGGEVDFNSHTLTFGTNAAIRLEGTGKVTDLTCVFPKLVLGEGYSGTYGALYAVSNTYELAGGTLHMTKDAAANATNVVVSSGILIVDISGEPAASVGTSYTLANVTLAEGASVDDITFKFSGQNFNCKPAWNAETKTLTVTTTAPDDGDNHWIGGAYGTFETAANWTLGTPTKDQRIVFDNEATVSFTTKPDIGTLVFNADVTFNRGSGGEKFHIQGAEGSGTLTLDYMGIANINGSNACISNNLNMINGSWFGDWQYTGNLSIYGDITGSGNVDIWGKSGNLDFYGDNSGFVGSVKTVDGHRPVYFRVPEAGFSNATSFELTGTLWLWFKEGTITFGGLKLHSTWNRGINMPYEAASGTGVVVVVGHNNGNVTMDGQVDKVYHAYTQTQDGKDWTEGCDKFTLKKIGTGTLSTYIENTCNIVLEGGTTSFAADCWGANITVKTNACLTATETLRTIGGSNGSLTMEAGSGIWLDNQEISTNLVADCDVDVTGVQLLASTSLTNALYTQTTPGKVMALKVTADYTISGTPADVSYPCKDSDKLWWKPVVSATELYLQRRNLAPGLMIFFK